MNKIMCMLTILLLLTGCQNKPQASDIDDIQYSSDMITAMQSEIDQLNKKIDTLTDKVKDKSDVIDLGNRINTVTERIDSSIGELDKQCIQMENNAADGILLELIYDEENLSYTTYYYSDKPSMVFRDYIFDSDQRFRLYQNLAGNEVYLIYVSEKYYTHIATYVLSEKFGEYDIVVTNELSVDIGPEEIEYFYNYFDRFSNLKVDIVYKTYGYSVSND